MRPCVLVWGTRRRHYAQQTVACDDQAADFSPLSRCAAGMSCRQALYVCSGDEGRVVIRLHTDPENRGTGAYQLLTPYTHGVPHVDCEGPSAVTRTNLPLPPGRKAPATRPHREMPLALVCAASLGSNTWLHLSGCQLMPKACCCKLFLSVQKATHGYAVLVAN